MTVHDWIQLWYIIRHRTVLVHRTILQLNLDKPFAHLLSISICSGPLAFSQDWSKHFTSSHHVQLTQAPWHRRWQWQERSGGKVLKGNWFGFCDWMPFLSPTGAEDIHWTSSFLHQPTDSCGKGSLSAFYVGSLTQYVQFQAICEIYFTDHLHGQPVQIRCVDYGQTRAVWLTQRLLRQKVSTSLCRRRPSLYCSGSRCRVSAELSVSPTPRQYATSPSHSPTEQWQTASTAMTADNTVLMSVSNINLQSALSESL